MIQAWLLKQSHSMANNMHHNNQLLHNHDELKRVPLTATNRDILGQHLLTSPTNLFDPPSKIYSITMFVCLTPWPIFYSRDQICHDPEQKVWIKFVSPTVHYGLICECGSLWSEVQYKSNMQRSAETPVFSTLVTQSEWVKKFLHLIYPTKDVYLAAWADEGRSHH